jgi:hypothetical protein
MLAVIPAGHATPRDIVTHADGYPTLNCSGPALYTNPRLLTMVEDNHYQREK